MKKISILWVDDEIDMLTAHILFLREKGYDVYTATNGEKALEEVKKNNFDLIFLDENMPGMSGMQTLSGIKDIKPDIPIVMITKNEEEDVMDQAIGSKISDYLIKPVNPKQILLCIKKNIDNQRLVSEKVTADYQSEFSKIGIQISASMSFSEWCAIYKKLVHWELEIESSGNRQMEEILKYQKAEANNEFAKYIKNNYLQWFNDENKEKPLLSPMVFRNRIFPLLDTGKKVFVIFIDNLRYDQWRVFYSTIKNEWYLFSDELFCSILPTTTQYARNAMFAGLMPLEIDKINPGVWLFDEEEGGKNLNEEELLRKYMARYGKSYTLYFDKIFNKKGEKKILKNMKDLLQKQLNILVYNFVDMLSHARTSQDIIKELADDEPAYRALTLSWFRHSHLFDLLKILAEHDVTVVVTTDHGSISVNNPVKIIGDRETSTNLRYKAGKSLNYNPKEVFEIRDLQKAHLPERNMAYTYIFSLNNDYFVYPNNYNHFVNYYKNTFQHGGVSLEEMLVPLAILKPNR